MSPEQKDEEILFSDLFVPLTTLKAIHLIVFVGILVFINGLFNEFVLDDIVQISNNVIIHSINNIVSFFAGSTFYNGIGQNLTGIYYRPIVSTVFSALYSAFGNNYFPFHLFQLIIYIANAVLVFFIFKHFFDIKISLYFALIYLIHPINSEIAFYISNTQEVLFVFFGTLALWLLIKASTSKYILGLVLCLFLSILSKETGLLFFGMTIIYAYLFKKKFLYILLGYSTIAFSLYLILRINAIGLLNNPTNVPIGNLSIFERVVHIPAMVIFYLKTFIFPVDLSSSYQWIILQMNFINFYLPLTLIIVFLFLIISFAIFLYKISKNYFKIYIFFLIWFITGLLFHLHLIPLDATVADRWFYFPMVGLLGMGGVLIRTFPFKKYTTLISIAIVIILILFSLRTIIRSFDWRDEYKLATHDITVSRDSYSLENTLSYALLKQRKFQDAKIHAERSIALYPHFTNYNNLGSIYANLGDYRNAKETYIKGLKYGDYYAIYKNLALLTLSYGEPSENILFLKETLKKYPRDPNYWLYLAIIEYRQSNTKDAKIAITQAYHFGSSKAVKSVYDRIMNNEPLNLNIKFTVENID